MQAIINLSDPWKMGEELGWPEIKCTVVHKGRDGWLIEIDHPFVYEKIEYRYVVVSPRLEGTSLANSIKENVFCSMLRTTTDRALSENPCDTSWWRGGGGAMIGGFHVVAT